MKIRDFFRMIIKLFGLYSIIQIMLYYIPVNLSTLLSGYDFTGILMLLSVLLIVIGVYFGIVKKVDTIIDWLKLDQGFDGDFINLGSLNERKIISLVSIIVGGFLIVDYVPSSLHYIYRVFEKTADNSGYNNPLFYDPYKVDYFDWGISTMNIIVGYLLITKKNTIVNLLINESEEAL